MDFIQEWAYSNTQLSYPFDAPVTPAALKSVVVDARVIDNGSKHELVTVTALSVTSLSPASASITAAYEGGSAFFTGTPAVTINTFGQWAVILFYEASSERRILLTVNTEAFTVPWSVTGADARFVARVHEQEPSNIESIQVTDSLTSAVHIFSSDAVQLKAGYNIGLELGTDTDIKGTDKRQGSVIELSATPGSGLGLYPNDCTGDGLLRTINGVGPDDNGNVTIDMQDCYRIGRTVGSYTGASITYSGNQITLYNDCEACCSCDDYQNVYEALRRVYNRGRNAGFRMQKVRDKYEGVNDDMRSEKTIRERRIKKMQLRPSAGYIMGVQLTFANNTSYDWADPLEGDFTIQSDGTDSDAIILPGSCYIFDSSFRFPQWYRIDSSEMFLDDTMDTPELHIEDVTVPDYTEETQPADLTYTITVRRQQYFSVFFEVFFPSGADGDTITVTYEDTDWMQQILSSQEDLLPPPSEQT